jgi:transposase InsO family protein
VLKCAHCVSLLPQRLIGVNTRGLKPLHVWQMDVTHIPEFGNLKYVHVSIDTYSGITFATAQTGGKAPNVISHCLQVFTSWGMPRHIETDNGPAYTSQIFSHFCNALGIKVIHGLPYNPQVQGIVERANATLKNTLIKQKGGMGMQFKSPRDKLNISLFILNF